MLKTSFRDLIITGWTMLFLFTVGLVAFHPSFKDEGIAVSLRTGGFALIPTLAGIGLMVLVETLGRSSSRSRRLALVIFVLAMLPAIPVGLETFGTPWAALIVVTLAYVRWKWALIAPVKKQQPPSAPND